VDICCRDLRRYLEYALKGTRGGVISVKMKNLLRAELPRPDHIRYSLCLSYVLRPWRWGGAYVVPRQDAARMLESFDELCAKAKRERAPKRREPRRDEFVPISFALPPDLLRAVDEYACLHNVPRSEVVRRAIDELLSMRRALEELAARDGPLERVSLRLPRGLLRAVDARAAALKTTRSALVRYAVAEMLERMKMRQQTPVQALP
jgi:metal-responsive CopG/Arc/MetJ family transcriptional regulator